MSSSATIIANPAARGATEAKLREAVGVLRAGGLEVETHVTSERGDAERLAREAAGKSPRFVVAAGGDGTYNEVANGLAGTGVPMAMLPLGTVNVLALELGVPFDAKAAARAALEGTPRPVTLGRIITAEQSRYFCLMAGIGYDAETVAAIHGGLKKLTGKGAYIARGLKVLLSWAPEELSITLDGAKHKAYSLIACNTARYAGRSRVAPDADITAPDLKAFLMHGGKRTDILRYAFGIVTGRHLRLKDITYAGAGRIEVEGSAPIQVDGDYMGITPAVITAAPGALRLIY
jgi:YegS/Rv2252/BmrU family lipid kinase